MAVAIKPADSTRSRVFLLDPRRLSSTKDRVSSADEEVIKELAALRAAADDALQVPPLSVTDKRRVPPSGDRHDYMSLGYYWWPNPETPDGLPYVVRDGEYNPEGDDFDIHRVQKLARTCHTLALAYFFTENERYAGHAANLLRVWFLDEKSRMNPHLNYAQAIPGICEGRGIGIIDTFAFPQLVDAVGLLESSAAWSATDQSALQDWMRTYLDWLLRSPHGKEEREVPNNHGTWYDVQAVALALFTDQRSLAAGICDAAKTDRIGSQILPDGRQPLELSRTLSFTYATWNLVGFLDLATMAQRLCVDLWHYKTGDGRNLRKAVDWLLPYAVGAKKWEHQQITKFDPAEYMTVLRRAAIEYQDPRYEEAIGVLRKANVATGHMDLLYPMAELNDDG